MKIKKFMNSIYKQNNIYNNFNPVKKDLIDLL